MPLYEFVCPSCDEHFESLRPMNEADDPLSCGQGHRARRALSVFARRTGDGVGPAPAPEFASPTGGGCCGGACGCG